MKLQSNLAQNKATKTHSCKLQLYKAGIGIVVRNQDGRVMAAIAEKIHQLASVETLEFLAARRAMLFAAELGFWQSIFEGNSEVTIRALQEGNSTISSVGYIEKDIMSISGSFVTHTFFHVRGQGNVVAHALAQRDRLFFPLLVWVEDVPLEVSHFVVFDFLSEVQ